MLGGAGGQDAEPPAGAAQGGGDAAEGEGGAARPAHPPQGRRAAGGAERGGAGRPERGAGRVGGSGPGAGASSSSSSSSEREGIARGPGGASGRVSPSCSEGRSAASRPWLLAVPQADLVSVWQSRSNKGLSVPCPQVEELALQSMIRSREEDAAVPAAAAAESQEVRAALGPAVGAASWAPRAGTLLGCVHGRLSCFMLALGWNSPAVKSTPFVTFQDKPKGVFPPLKAAGCWQKGWAYLHFTVCKYTRLIEHCGYS